MNDISPPADGKPADGKPADAAAQEGELPKVPAWQLAVTFNEIALSSFGGGLSAWSREMVVSRRGWMTDAEFLSAMTICRILPGANQVNVAVFVGTKLAGARGAAGALVGLIAVPTLLLVGIAAIYAIFQKSPVLHHVLGGFAAAAIAMTLSMVWRTGRSTLTSVMPILLFGATFLLNGVLRWPLWWTLAITAPIGIAWAWRHAAPAKPTPPGPSLEVTPGSAAP